VILAFAAREIALLVIPTITIRMNGDGINKEKNGEVFCFILPAYELFRHIASSTAGCCRFGFVAGIQYKAHIAYVFSCNKI